MKVHTPTGHIEKEKILSIKGAVPRRGLSQAEVVDKALASLYVDGVLEDEGTIIVFEIAPQKASALVRELKTNHAARAVLTPWTL